MLSTLSQHWSNIQASLFPHLQNECGTLSDKHEQLIEIIDFARISRFLPYYSGYVGRPAEDRAAIARAFIAKAVFGCATTRALIDRLHCDVVTRRICGWERRSEIPSESTFSRAFSEFAKSELPLKLQQYFVKKYHGQEVIFHSSRDSTAIEAREKAAKKPKKQPKEKKKCGRKKRGEAKPQPVSTRLMRQLDMSLPQMLADLPKQCDIGAKINAKGHLISWKGYKLHIDTIDGDIPISAILTSASVHDSQVAIPLSKMTEKNIDNILYELMDSAYDAEIIRDYVKNKGRVALIDFNRRSKKDQRSFTPCEARRYKGRSAAERVNSNLKDNFGGKFVRVRGHAKVAAHLMFGLLALTINQSIRLIT